MSNNSKNDDKKGLFSVVAEDIKTILLITLRTIIAMALTLIITIPVIFFVLKALSVLVIPLSGLRYPFADIILYLLTVAVLVLLLYKGRNRSSKISGWIMTGQIEIEVSDENNRKMRGFWLKAHKGIERTKNIKWKFNLNNKTDFYILETVYPVDKYGHAEVTKAPVCFRALVPITHKFLGNLPVQGDTISFSWTTCSNNDIKKLHVRAVEYIEKNDNIPESTAKWIELDEKGTEGIVCAEDLETGKKSRIEGTIKLAEKCNEKIQLCFWYDPEDAEGESVLREKF